MKATQRNAKTAAAKAGVFAAFASLLGPRGIGAPPTWPLRRDLLSVACLSVLSLACLFAAAPALAAGDANEIFCPPETEASPGFRAFLPDCRAYELVSPAYKGGSPLFEPLPAISKNGQHLIVDSWGGFAGTGNNENFALAVGGAVYELSRSVEGWSAEALAPPATEVSHGGYVAASSDLSRTLWELIEEPAPPETELLNALTRDKLAIRVHEPGSPPRFETVGPQDNPNEALNNYNFRFRGASSDLSHVVYSIFNDGNEAIWPGDQTENNRESLYEYVGVHNSEPTLVGVKNDGAPPWEAGATHVNEGAELISTCGTEFGGDSKYNAISASGDTIFFTAQSGFSGECPGASEVYARLGEAKTLALSEPLLTVPGRTCTGTCKEDENQENGHERREGVFGGASADGSKVFFTTEQPLLDEDEDEGNDLYMEEIGCPAGNEGCEAAEKEVTRLVLVSHDPNAGEAAEVLPGGVARISENGERVYFVAYGVLTAEPNREGKSPTAGEKNLYVYDAASGETKFVAELSSEDSEIWKREDRRRVEATPDGRFFIFRSQNDLTADDTSTQKQLFEYDAEAERLVRVSIGQCPAGTPSCAAGERFNDNGNISENQLVPRIIFPNFEGYEQPTEAQSRLSLSSDGRVFFVSLDALTPLASQGSKNIYEYSGDEVYLIAAGEDPALESSVFGASFPEFFEEGRLISADAAGTDLFFGSIGQLVPQDTDTQADLYDARVEGGFPAPAAAAACQGESCRGAGSAAPPLASPASASFAGSGNARPRRHHKHRRHHRRRSRAANANRRAGK